MWKTCPQGRLDRGEEEKRVLRQILHPACLVITRQISDIST